MRCVAIIEGLEILSPEPIMECTYLGLKICLIGGIISLIIGVLLEIFYFQDCTGIGLFLIGAVLCLFVGAFIDANYEIPTGKYEYKVIIDDNVSMAEFYEHYEVVDQEGKIFIVREKDDVDG